MKTRLSPITLGMSALTLAILCVAALLLARTRRHARADGDGDLGARRATMEADDRNAAPPATPPRPTREPPSRPAPSPATAVAETAAAVDAGVPVDDPPPAGGTAPAGRRAALILNHNRRLEEADAQAFEALRIPDDTRASIRRINDEYRQRTERGLSAPGAPDQTPSGEAIDDVAAAKARQDALRLLLGEAPARDFDGEERGAIRRLRGKYRFEWGRQLRQ